jgi:hypothetical protein
MAHRTGGDDLDRRLHGDGKLLVHFDGDALDSGLCDANQSLLNDGMWGENGKIGFGDDFEFHPGHLKAKHNREPLFDFYNNKDAVGVAQASAEVKTGCGVLGAIDEMATAGNKEEALQEKRFTQLAEPTYVPFEFAVIVANASVEVKAG